MNSDKLFKFVFMLCVGLLYSACSHAMDDRLVIMDNDIANLAPKTHALGEKELRTINRLYSANPQLTQELSRIEHEVRTLVGAMQLGIAQFQDAFAQGRVNACSRLHQQLMNDWDKLQALTHQISSGNAQMRAPTPVEIHRAPMPHRNSRHYSVDELAAHALDSSRIARQAHMSRPPILRKERFLMAVDPTHLSPDGLPGVPHSIAHLPGVQILYYPSPNMPSRVNGGCGTRAIGNALAIRDAVRTGSLNPRTVLQCATHHNDLNSHASTRHDEAVDMALALNLSNVHAFGFCGHYTETTFQVRNGHQLLMDKKEVEKPNPFMIIASTSYRDRNNSHNHVLHDPAEEDRFQANIMQEIRNAENIVVHFWCGVDREKNDDHCVLISIVKQAGNVPKIIYMDCNNEPIMDQSKDAAFIHYLYLQCIA